MQRLLIADSSVTFSDALADAFRDDFEVRVCRDGETALAFLLSFQPDVLVINLSLPYMDGLTVLQHTARVPPVTVAITYLMNSYVEQTCLALGVGYLLIMPTVEATRLRVLHMLKENPPTAADLHAQTVIHLRTLNFLTHLDGYRQLCAGIPLFFQDPHQRLTKELYPKIAAACGCMDARTVEHSIRTAIEAAWNTRGTAWANYFPPDSAGYIRCPTNKEFISRIAEMLHTQ